MKNLHRQRSTVSMLLADLNSRGFRHIKCVYLLGAKLATTLKDCGLKPGMHGVYLYSVAGANDSPLLYVGKAGTWTTKRGLGRQDLLGRIGNQHDEMSGRQFLNSIMRKKRIKQICIDCLIIPNPKKSTEIPATLEAEFIRRHFVGHSDLPEFNKSY